MPTFALDTEIPSAFLFHKFFSAQVVRSCADFFRCHATAFVFRRGGCESYFRAPLARI